MISADIGYNIISITDEKDAAEFIAFAKEIGANWSSGRDIDGPSSDGKSIINRIKEEKCVLALSPSCTVVWAYGYSTNVIPWQDFKQRFNIGSEPVCLTDYLL